MDKKKILFVVLDFYKAGAERFAFEVDRALDKSKFEITILCLGRKKEINSDWGVRFYENEHKNLGSKIEFIDSFENKTTVFHKILKKINKKLYSKWYKSFNPKINLFINNFDLIHWMGEYTLLPNLNTSVLEKSIINSMSAKFQNPSLYNKFDFNFQYNFISGFDEDETIYEYSQFKSINHCRIPLLFKIPFETNQWKYKQTAILKIGIFTRLSIYKPLDPFFYAFHLLLEQLPNTELHVFGTGNPEKEGMNRYLQNLNLRDKVFFRGHQENIVETVLNEHINLSWFQGYNNDRPAGYAGFDICSTGTPLICWDFLEKPKKAFNEIYPHYKNLKQFVSKSVEILTNKEEAEKLSELQFNDVFLNRDISKQIHKLEAIYFDIICKNENNRNLILK